MIDHVCINVADLGTAKAFYQRVLGVVGLETIHEIPEHAVGFGASGRPWFWLVRRDPAHSAVHVAFAAGDRPTVDAFHAAALAAGGTDNGPPGVREQYHPDYYGAFVLDPEGNNVEAVCRRPG